MNLAKSTPISADYAGLLTEPSPQILERAQDYIKEIQPWYWQFGHRVRKFYRDTVASMDRDGQYLCLTSGDVRCGKSVVAAMWAAEEPQKVAYENLQGMAVHREAE